MCLLDGNDVDSHDCFFIDPHLSGRDQFLTELSQPVWEEQSTGKVRLIKAPDGARPAPISSPPPAWCLPARRAAWGWKPE